MKASLQSLVIAAVLAAGLAAWISQPASHRHAGPMLAELKTIVTPPPPPPPVDSNTVDLRDKKGPLIPHIPSVVATEFQAHLLAATRPDNRTIFNPAPPPPPPTV